MNYLAHLYLARPDADAMLGALLGDFVFGTTGPDAYAPVIRREIHLHRQVDSFTDAHPAVDAARDFFADGRRRFSGIALDVFYDHCLAREWERWSEVPLAEFTADFYAHLLANLPILPERLRRLAPLMAHGDWLGSYRERANVDLAVRRIATRLSRSGDRLVACLEDLREHEDAIAAGFQSLFPDLMAHSAALRAAADRAPAG